MLRFMMLACSLALPSLALGQCPGGNCAGAVRFVQPQAVQYVQSQPQVRYVQPQQVVRYVSQAPRPDRIVQVHTPYSRVVVQPQRVQVQVTASAPVYRQEAAYAQPRVVRNTSLQRVPGPSWGYRGAGGLAYHVSNHHGIDTTGMTPQEVQIAHDNAHNAGGSVGRSVARTRSVFRNRLFFR